MLNYDAMTLRRKANQEWEMAGLARQVQPSIPTRPASMSVNCARCFWLLQNSVAFHKGPTKIFTWRGKLAAPKPSKGK